MDTSPRTYRFLPVDVYTSGYRVVGKVMVSTNGIMGVLNDINKSHVEVHDARLARVHMPTKLVDHFEVVRLVKTDLCDLRSATRRSRSLRDSTRWIQQHLCITGPADDAGL